MGDAAQRPSGHGLHAAFRPIHPARLAAALQHAWRWLSDRRQAQTGARRMRVLETVHLGEKRFVSLLDVDGARMLIGGGAGEVNLLARMDAAEHAGDMR